MKKLIIPFLVIAAGVLICDHVQPLLGLLFMLVGITRLVVLKHLPSV